MTTATLNATDPLPPVPDALHPAADMQDAIADKVATAIVPPEAMAETGRPKVVIIGAGFAGLSAAQVLANKNVDVTLIDRRNYHLFQPLLYQVATAGLSPADISAPIRGVVAKFKNVAVALGTVTGVDKENRKVLVGDRAVPYDHLIVATGARHSYFGRDEWEPFAPGLKSIDDATEVRRRILLSFERAEAADDPEERQRLMNFVIVGGGPTGVEMAGAIAELAKTTLAADFRRIDPRMARIILVESGPRVLAVFTENCSGAAKGMLEKLGVEVRLGKPVSKCDGRSVTVGDETIPCGTVIWAAGVAASPAAKWLGAETDRQGRAIVNKDCTVPGHPEIFVVGDTAHVQGADGKPYPGIAPAAKQAGMFAAKAILTRIKGGTPPAEFHYKHMGNLATIGRKSAIVDLNGLRFGGFFAWLLWSLAHVYFLIGFRNRIVVAMNWMWAYVTFQRGARLITGPIE